VVVALNFSFFFVKKKILYPLPAKSDAWNARKGNLQAVHIGYISLTLNVDYG
jgi:hypothetical protein